MTACGKKRHLLCSGDDYKKHLADTMAILNLWLEN
jgi:hypothetical protein